MIMALHENSPQKKLGNYIFDLVTLTFDLDHRPCLRFYRGKCLCPYVKRFDCESAHRQTEAEAHRQTHRVTDGAGSITSTSDVGGDRARAT